VSQGEWEEFSSRFGDRLALDEPLSGYTTYRIGGPAAAMLFSRSTEDVADALRLCADREIPWVALGLGSNVLIADEGFPGLVLRIGKGFDGVLEQSEDGFVWRMAAGMPTPRLARQTAKAGVVGVHKLVGVPGTVGGGVATNAGAHGQEYSRIVRNVECVATDGTATEISGQEIDWQYRKGLEGVAVTAVTFEFETGDSEEQLDEIKHLQAGRKEHTPYDMPCCGSVFKNPGPPASAGQLIDSADLKGFRVGAAEVSKKHANYIVNLGGATAAEVLEVIEAVRGRVLGAFGVELELEVRIIE